MAPVIQTIGDPLEVGTRIHWDEPTQSFYYVDVPESKIYKYHPSTGKISDAVVGTEPLGFAFPTTSKVDGSTIEFIAALARKFVLFEWDGLTPKVNNLRTIGEVDGELSDNRLNGGKVDPSGRLWAGTMGPSDSQGTTIPARGSLFSVTKGKIKKHESSIGISNGLAFNVKEKKMYYIDTLFDGIYQYDYDSSSGDITNRKVIFEFAKNGIEGRPDGLTIDTDGNLWVAMIWGSTVVQVNPATQKLLQVLKMPTSEITALSFGNRKLDELYVNSAKMPVGGKVPAHPAGCNFKVTNLGRAKGLPGDRYISG